jgi:hypothetical protein
VRETVRKKEGKTDREKEKRERERERERDRQRGEKETRDRRRKGHLSYRDWHVACIVSVCQGCFDRLRRSRKRTCDFVL